MQIIHPIKGKIEFEPYFYQKELMDKILSGRNIIVKSSRQMGVTTTMLASISLLCETTPGYKALVVWPTSYFSSIEYKFPDSVSISRRWKYKVEFKNGSIVEFFPGSNINNRSFADYEIFFDLYNHISKSTLENVYASVNPDPEIRFFSFTGLFDFSVPGFEELIWYRNYRPEFNSDEWKNKQIRILGTEIYNKEFIEQ